MIDEMKVTLELDQLVEAVEELPQHGIFVSGLQEQDRSDGDGKLKQRESGQAADWSKQQLDHAHGRFPIIGSRMPAWQPIFRA